MKTTTLLMALWPVAAAAGSPSFPSAPLLAEQDVDVLNRTVAREAMDRDLFGAPWATVVIENVDVYDRLPYLEARTFQIVSDPAWNRLLFGEMGRGLAAHDGTGDPLGPLAGPHGLSVDPTGRLFVADTDNHRVLVYETWTEYDSMELRPLFAIEDVSRPFDVAHSDGGTPFDPGDDRLYVAETGRNRVTSFELTDTGAQRTASIGTLGSGVGHFAGPLAITVGRADGANTSDVYVADAHSARLVHLVDEGDHLRWGSSTPQEGGPVTSLDTDHWGNVYAVSPAGGCVTKYTAVLVPVARLDSGVDRPRSFHVPFFNRNDHRRGTVERRGHGSGIIVEEWNGSSGIRLVHLGVAIENLEVRAGDDVAADFLLTDRGSVRGEIRDATTGRLVHRTELGTMDAGAHSISLPGSELAMETGDYVLRLGATSSYRGVPSHEGQSGFSWDGAARTLPAEATLLGNEPNPFRQDTVIHFAIPEGLVRTVALRVYDVSGRLIRTLADGEMAAGIHSRTWDGTGGSGVAVASGVYWYRLSVGGVVSTRKAVFLR